MPRPGQLLLAPGEQEVGRDSGEAITDAEAERLWRQCVISRPQIRLLEPNEAAIGPLVVAIELDLPSRGVEETVR